MRILILGGNGMIGHKMYKVLSNYHYDTWVIIKKNYQDLNCNYLFAASAGVQDEQRVKDVL